MSPHPDNTHLGATIILADCHSVINASYERVIDNMLRVDLAVMLTYINQIKIMRSLEGLS